MSIMKFICNQIIFFIYFPQHFVYMNTDLQPNLQYITYDIIHMFMGDKKRCSLKLTKYV